MLFHRRIASLAFFLDNRFQCRRIIGLKVIIRRTISQAIFVGQYSSTSRFGIFAVTSSLPCPFPHESAAPETNWVRSVPVKCALVLSFIPEELICIEQSRTARSCNFPTSLRMKSIVRNSSNIPQCASVLLDSRRGNVRGRFW